MRRAENLTVICWPIVYRPVVSNLWYAYLWGCAADLLGVRENNIGNGGKHQKKKDLK
jgi:hypothetical protein